LASEVPDADSLFASDDDSDYELEEEESYKDQENGKSEI